MLESAQVVKVVKNPATPMALDEVRRLLNSKDEAERKRWAARWVYMEGTLTTGEEFEVPGGHTAMYLAGPGGAPVTIAPFVNYWADDADGPKVGQRVKFLAQINFTPFGGRPPRLGALASKKL
jgi:hypothetical protein